MTVYNLGSINADFVYQVPHLPTAGETLAATELVRGLGGKGANMSVACARAAARVVHIGAVGPDGAWAVQRMLEYGVDTRFIAEVEQPTGHAIIAVAPGGENSILLFPGANMAIQDAALDAGLAGATERDSLLLQNETNAQDAAVRRARVLGMRIVYAAAPFDLARLTAVLPQVDVLVLNQVEAQHLEHALGAAIADLGVRDVLVTLGADGCRWFGPEAVQHFDAIPVTPVDTTSAGDTFTGWVVAGLDRGLPMAQAIGQAQIAAALMVTRVGTADVIPDLRDVQDFSL